MSIPKSHGRITARLADGLACLGDLGLGLGGQPDVFAGQLFRAGQVGRGPAHLFEQRGRSAARLGQLHPDPVERIGGGLVMLVRRQPVFLMTARARRTRGWPCFGPARIPG